MTAIGLHAEIWSPSRTALFATRRDVRDLLVVDHPWEPSTTGGFGQWEATVAAPAGWQAGQPLFLSFYQSDNYSGAWMENAWLGTQAFFGHRIKQVLVNGRVVWESDVADVEWEGDVATMFAVPPGQPGWREAYRVVDISDSAAETMTVTFRVVDRVASTEPLPGDAYKRFVWSQHNPHEASRKFQTTVYFGDVFLTGEAAIVRPERPAPTLRDTPDTAERITAIPLTLSGPDHLPAPGFPVRCGVPLPRGAVAAGTPFALRNAAGDVPVQTSESDHWPDGSVRWVLCEFVAGQRGGYTLHPGRTPVLPASPVQLEGRTISTGQLTLTLGEAEGRGVFAGITAEHLALGPLDLSIKLNRVGWRDHFTARRTVYEIERATPLCAVVRLEGDMLDARGVRFGPWRARVHLWAGLPYLLLEWTLTNESDQAMAMLLDWSARVPLPDLADAVADFGSFAPGFDPEDIGVKAMGHHGTLAEPRAVPLYRDAEVSCRQERADQARIYRNTTWAATSATAPGFLNLNHSRGGLVAAMRWFAEEFPSGIIVRPDELILATMPESQDALAWPHDRPSARLGRGEAKRQTLALWLHDGALPAEEAERFNACVQDAPHLFDAGWFTGSGALEAGPPRDHPALAGWRAALAPVIERSGLDAPRLGLREYWDTCWSNDYRGRAHLGLMQYLETGDRRWFRYFDAACTHTRDVDLIHFCPEHPEWMGSCHSYGEDHTSCGPMGNIGLNCDSLLDHYLLTGDPDSLAAAAGLAEHILGCATDRCARVVGWPLAQLVRWYEHTGDARFLRKAQEFVDAARQYTEPRRGVFSEIHGSWNYLGPVSFMTGYLAFGLIRYHQLTGDPGVLALLAGQADGVFAEIHPAPGRFRYSPLPENNPRPYLRGHNPLLGGLCGYLAHVTVTPRYAAWARECYDALIEPDDEPATSMDMLQLAGWLLKAVAEGGGTVD